MAKPPPGAPLFDAQHTSPPRFIVNRKVTVELGKTAAVRYPGDLFEKREATWFESGSDTQRVPRRSLEPHRMTFNNHVQFLIDGSAALESMARAIGATKRADDFIYMLNWWADPSMQLTDNGKRLGDLLGEARDKGVQVCGIFFKMFGQAELDAVAEAFGTVAAQIPLIGPLIAPFNLRRGLEAQNEAMVDFINNGRAVVNETLFNPDGEDNVVEHFDPQTKNDPDPKKRKIAPVGAAIHYRRLNRLRLAGVPVTVGSQHQKILCVKAGGKLTAFCGGIDFNRDRREFQRLTFRGAPLHDMHCEVRGPAAGQLLATFVQVWNDHPEGQRVRLRATNADLTQPRAPKGRHIIQMGRTFGRQELFGSTSQNAHYRFAPAGERTAARLMRHVIPEARKFIYLEDQYFVNLEAATLLERVLVERNLAHITIVLPHHEIGDMPLMVKHRRAAIRKLKERRPERVRIFYRCGPGVKPGENHTYVHSKITIVDDEIAIIGTVNYARRSWTHDSEVCLGIYDPSSDQVLTSRFAHWLRMRIWAEHLFGTVKPPRLDDEPPRGLSDHEYAELFDGVAAGALWQRLIDLKRAFLKKNPLPRARPGGGIPPRPRDSGYVQTAQAEELARNANVRPYDETDDPQEISLTNLPLIPNLIPLAPSPEIIYDTFVDPAG